MTVAGRPVLALPDGIVVTAGEQGWQLPPVELEAGAWLLVQCRGTAAASAVARALVGLRPPREGRVLLVGGEPADMSYSERMRHRRRVGFVAREGGLLFNRSVRDNLRLPLSVHGGIARAAAEQAVAAALAAFGLTAAADSLPHLLDGAERWRACVARALLLEPALLVVEGCGPRPVGDDPGWARVTQGVATGRLGAAVVCHRSDAELEGWLAGRGVRLLRIACAAVGRDRGRGSDAEGAE